MRRTILFCLIVLLLPGCAGFVKCGSELPENVTLAPGQNLAALDHFDQASLFGFYRCRAGLDDEEGQYRTGLAYENGIGTDQSYRWAFQWYQKAAKSKTGLKWTHGSEIAIREGPRTDGHPIAQYRLGLMYLNGFGRGQSDDFARTWLRRSAEQGCSEARVIYQALMEKYQENE